MVRDMTIGQFYNTDSVIHRLDSRTKIIFTFVYVITLFLGRNPFLYLAAFVVLSVCIYLSHVPLKFILKGLKALGMVILFTMLVNLFTVQGVKTLVEWKFIRITEAGLASAVYLGIKLVLMIIGSSMLTYTTTPNVLADGLEKMLGWMKKWNVPVHEFAMIMSIALRFVPILVEELDKIMKAQMARGIDFGEGNLFVRLRKLMPIVVPLFVAAIRRSDELALAMDARCYHGGEGRTKMKPLQYRRQDCIAYIFVVIYLAGMIVLAVMF
ncbi:MAG: energy-coupling factor transporter transmembrane protein EcfT [Bacteroidales bacterium]|nr:energy-coupling factor transporter transmembrane protein EcfT [Clostridium sp.]MCM1203758.1 energy-coupling factor transporter transmembrane protein EcfT [Bacteroidales bacterium]